MAEPRVPAVRARVREALMARRWALGVLSGAPPEAAPPLSAAGWAVFLTAERCALALLRRLGERADGVVGPVGAPLLREHALVELQRALSLQDQLRTVAGLLRARGWRAVALKSGAELADGGDPIDVVDLDVLVHADQAAALASDLHDLGSYDVVGTDAEPGSVRWEAAKRAGRGSVMIEIHHSVPYLGEGVDPWDDARPTRVDGVLRPAPALHLWHLLVHGVVHHPERFGSLRDLLLLGAAARACDPDELAWVRRRAAGTALGNELLALLDAARGIEAGGWAGDPFSRVAALRYRAVLAGAGLAGVSRLLPRIWTAAFALAGGRAPYRALWYGSQRSVLLPAEYRGETRLDRSAPRLSRLLRSARRALFLAAATPGAWLLSRQADRAARSVS